MLEVKGGAYRHNLRWDIKSCGGPSLGVWMSLRPSGLLIRVTVPQGVSWCSDRQSGFWRRAQARRLCRLGLSHETRCQHPSLSTPARAHPVSAEARRQYRRGPDPRSRNALMSAKAAFLCMSTVPSREVTSSCLVLGTRPWLARYVGSEGAPMSTLLEFVGWTFPLLSAVPSKR